MALTSSLHPDDLPADRYRAVAGVPAASPRTSAVAWGAIAAGAAAAASLSLILLMLGVGLGLSSVSPWAGQSVSAATFGVSTILWLTVTQLLASGMGGYLAGRLRTRWVDIEADESYFRDTAHGFLAWALASLATAALLTSVIGSIVSGGVQAGASVAGSVAGAASNAAMSTTANGGMAESTSYFVDLLFRNDPNRAPAAADSSAPVGAATIPTTTTTTTAERPSEPELAEVGRIFVNAGSAGALPTEDARYVGQIVSRRTGLSPQVAQGRVNDVYTKAQAQVRATQDAAREAADKARKASAYGALWLFVSLLMGAFVASLAATWGGHRRDA